MRLILYLIFSLIVISNCISPDKNNMNKQSEFTKEIAIEYIAAYARFEKVDLNEGLKINNPVKIRGDIGAAEFEYKNNEKLLIVRGLINKDIGNAGPSFKKLILEKLLGSNNSIGNKFHGAIFEFDTTAIELQNDFPERINLRLDFKTPIGKTEFVKIVDELMDDSFKYSQNSYRTMIYEISREHFPSKK